MQAPSLICRGKNLHLAVLKQFLYAIPKTPMAKSAFFAFAEKRMLGFTQTHSQIARQMALYYTDGNGLCHPRFTAEISPSDALRYARYWAERYFVPNPYTPSFPQDCKPTCVYGFMRDNCGSNGVDLDASFVKMFNRPLNEVDKAKAYLLQFTDLIETENGRHDFLDPSDIHAAVDASRSDEEAFFHYFDGWDSGVANNGAIVSETTLRIFVSKVLTYLYDNEDSLVALFNESELYPSNGETRIKVDRPSHNVYLTGLFVQATKEYVESLNNKDANHTRWFVDKVYKGKGGDNYLSGEWTYHQSPPNNPKRVLALTFPSFKNLVEWLYPGYQVQFAGKEYVFEKRVCSKTDDPVASGLQNDIVDAAIELFKTRRASAEWHSDDPNNPGQCEKLNRDVRSYFSAFDPLSICTHDAFSDFCIRHTWGLSNGNGWTSLCKYDDAQIVAFSKWLKSSVACTEPSLTGLVVKDNGMPGIKNSSVTELMMRFHPESFCVYNRTSHDVLCWLGLLDGKFDSSYAYPEYIVALGRFAELRARLESAELTRMVDDDLPPDFLTVNEFIYWCDGHRDDILKEAWEKTMKTEIKKVNQMQIDNFKDFIAALEKDVFDAGLKYAPNLMKRFVCAQLAKPFVVLTGLSGSGKTKLAEAFTRWIGVEGTYRIVPVGADWTNSEKMLGYPNALDPKSYVMPDTGVLSLMLDAVDHPELPFFLILDEMNLSHVERYFADFLSTMESGDEIKLYDGEQRYAGGRPIPDKFAFPKNLFVIGTMNVDETTYMFSPKVLDRAQVIEFRVSEKEIEDFLVAPSNPNMASLDGKGACFAEAFLALAAGRTTKTLEGSEKTALQKLLVGTKQKNSDKLDGLFTALADLGAEFGYRSAIEIVTFIAYYLEASGYGELKQSIDKEKCLNAAIDAAVLQKLLPKLHGSLNHLMPVLEAMIGKVSKKETPVNDPEAASVEKPIYSLTYEKLHRMKTRLDKNGFTSFAEA